MADTGRRTPHQYLLFELTKRCQNNCAFCYNVWKEEGDYPQEELSFEETVVVLRNAIRGSGCKNIGLSGGEPLLKKGFFEIASFVSSQGVTPILITNGKLLTREAVAEAMECGVGYFEISLHSDDRSIHDGLVGRRGSFDEVIDAILNVREAGGQVYTVFVATKKNVRTFKNFVELNALLGVRWILFNRVACGGSCLPDWISLAPSPSDLQQALDEGVPVAEKYKIGLSAGVQVQPCLVDLSKYGNFLSAHCPLNENGTGHTYFTIDPAGNLRMCNRSKIILGSLLKEEFGAISESPVVKEFRAAVPDFCLDCKLAAVCSGGCKADAMSYYGTLSKPDPFLELWKDRVAKIPPS
ncbi:MAG TPA: radical SAM protein [Patescibacteria group bacterium]|nr:radical SAM protein [Patescibacteria group bacterium]